jgi:CDP-6-deoxy-D-xylo-4-hexulose-3-dehydrase
MTKARQTLKEALAKACDEELRFRFDPKNPVVRLHEPTYHLDEVWECVDSLLTTRITMGPKVKAFEKQFGERFGYPHSMMVNSGSSANLLAVAALANKVTTDYLKPGDEVVVPALCWSTSVWPLIQHQLVPVIIDMDPATLNLDPAELERAIGPKTRGVVTVPIYGNPCPMDAVMGVVNRHNLVLIEDCCESLGATYGERPVGSFGRAGTFSFYFSHHITTMEGGMTVTSEPDLADTMRVLRAHGWIRDTLDPVKQAGAHPRFHPRFLFTNIGYNLRATELAGGFGTVQLKRFDPFLEIRRNNAAFWHKAFAPFADFFEIQTETPGSQSTWFGFPMTVKEAAPFSAQELCAHLESRGIETRPLSAGNIAEQPGLQLYSHRVVGDLKWANRSLARSFTFGNHQEVNEEARQYIVDVMREFLKA